MSDLMQRLAGLSPAQRRLLEMRRAQRSAGGETARGGIPVRGAGHAPLSFPQRRLWFLDRLEPGNAFYNLSSSLRMEGALDVRAMQRALSRVVARHQVLRTVFRPGGEDAVQVVLPARGVPLPLADLSTLPREEREEEARRWATEEARRPFDLFEGPLFRARVIRLEAGVHVLVLTMHHIVTDGWSWGVLYRELDTLYGALTRGEAASLPDLPLQYGDFAAWQRARISGEVLDRHLAHWRERLAGAPAALELPTDHPRPAVQRFRGASHRFLLPRPVAESLKELARQEGATLYMVLLAGFYVLLSRWSGQEDVVVGTPIANRTRSELEGLVGFFVNTLALRTRLSGDPSFRELLGRVRQTTLDAYAHQDLPFERLVEELKVERDLSRQPLFQAMLMLLSASPPTRLPGLACRPVAVESGTSIFDLTLYLAERDDGVHATLEYNTDLFTAATAERLGTSYRTLLEGVAAGADLRLSALPLLSAPERRRMEAWNATDRTYSETRCIHQIIQAQAARTPGAAAVTFEGIHLSYGELERRANQLARRLRREGVGPEVRVGICMERSPELVVALLGVLKAGGVYVPLDPGYPQERLAYMLADSGVKVLLVQERLRDGLSLHSARVVCLDAGWEEVSGESEEALPVPLEAEGLAYVIYTSGSTGRPKGAMNTHAGIRNRILWMQEEYGLDSSDAVLQKTPFSFDVSVWEFFWPLMTGARLVMARPEGHRDGAYLVDVIARERITTLHFVPSMLQVFLEEPGLERCGSLRRVICSGEALPPDLQERFFARMSAHTGLHNLYGPTEAAVDVTAWACERGSPRRSVPIGRPIANTRILVLDRSLNAVPVGVAGELHIGGVQVGRGYLDRPELTAEKFVPDPFGGPGARLYRTGDLTRWLPDGSIEYLGRLDHQVKIRGFRIELGEIEAVLAAHPQVREAVVVVREDTPGEKRLVAYLVAAEGASPAAGELRSALREQLPEHMVPSAFAVLPEIPLSPNGKVDRRALLAVGADRPDLEAGYVAPQSELERQIAGIWAEVLGVEKVGVHDNFFDLGGHSLLLVRVHGRLRATLDRDVSVVELFQRPTVHGLAEHLLGDRAASPALERVDARAARQKGAIERQRQLAMQRRQGNV